MQDWVTVTSETLQKFWESFLLFLPKLILALVIFLVGWFISAGIGRIIEEILKRLKFDKLFSTQGWQEAMEKAEIKTKPSGFIGALCKWILVLVTLAISVEVLGLPQFSAFLHRIIAWLPNLVVAILIFVATVIFAHFVEKITKASVERAKVGYAGVIGSVAKWAIWVFGILAVLLQLGIAKELVIALFYGIVGFITLAGGLAFGLGGKELAGEILNSLKEKIRK